MVGDYFVSFFLESFLYYTNSYRVYPFSGASFPFPFLLSTPPALPPAWWPS